MGKKFTTENLQKVHKPEKGDCKTCDKKQVKLCKHGYCAQCLCQHYCWLD